MVEELAVLSQEAQAILSLVEGGERVMPLVLGRQAPEKAAEWMRATPLQALGGTGRSAEGVRAGLWVYFGDFEEAHETAQEMHTVEGSYWHGIVHRMEPDDWNAGYWFRRVGEHAVYGRLAARAAELGYGDGRGWDPFAFVEFCARARAEGGAVEELARKVQMEEWKLLLAHCAGAK